MQKDVMTTIGGYFNILALNSKFKVLEQELEDL
jgi:hypothetical protein